MSRGTFLAHAATAALLLALAGCGGGAAATPTPTPIFGTSIPSPSNSPNPIGHEWTGSLHMNLMYGAGCSATANAQLVLSVGKDGAVAGTSKGSGTYRCHAYDHPPIVNVPVSGQLTGSAFQMTIPIGAPLAYDPVTVPLTSSTTAHAQTNDVQGIRTYTIDLTCSNC